MMLAKISTLFAFACLIGGTFCLDEDLTHFKKYLEKFHWPIGTHQITKYETCSQDSSSLVNECDEANSIVKDDIDKQMADMLINHKPDSEIEAVAKRLYCIYTTIIKCKIDGIRNKCHDEVYNPIKQEFDIILHKFNIDCNSF